MSIQHPWGRALRGFVAGFCGLALLVARPLRAQGAEPESDHQVITLWPSGAPGAKGADPKLDVPTLTVWLPKAEAATGAAVVVCPGGG